jgi:micrococcal nuclease
MDAPANIPAEVVSVYDGDTIKVIAHPWPGISLNTSVRVRGIDTPEIRGKCQSEKLNAIKARDQARSFVGTHVILNNIELGKYAGRVIADVLVGDEDLGEFLINSGLARPYDGGKRKSWCE